MASATTCWRRTAEVGGGGDDPSQLRMLNTILPEAPTLLLDDPAAESGPAAPASPY